MLLPENGVAVIKSSNNKCLLKVYDESKLIDLKRKRKLSTLKDVLEEFKGKRVCIVNSDVYDIVNEKVKIKNLEKHNLKRILLKVVEDSYTFMTNVSKEEGEVDVLLHVETDESALTVTAGLEGDTQVLLFDIHYERNERSIKC